MKPRRQNLTEGQKEAIVQMHLEGKKVEDIAHAVGKWPVTVRTYLDGKKFELYEMQGLRCDGTPKPKQPSTDEVAKKLAAELTKPKVVQMPKPEPEPAPKSTDPEPIPWCEWVSRRIGELQSAMLSRLSKRADFPDEWLQEYRRDLKALEEFNGQSADAQ